MSEGPKRLQVTPKSLLGVLLIIVAWGANDTAVVANLFLLSPATPVGERPAHTLTKMIAIAITGAGVGAGAGLLAGKPVRRALVWALAGALGWSIMFDRLF